MKKIRDGISGEVTAEIFETWFPDKPEVILMDFLKTEQPEMIIVKRLDTGDFAVSRFTVDYARKLLDEFKLLHRSFPVDE